MRGVVVAVGLTGVVAVATAARPVAGGRNMPGRLLVAHAQSPKHILFRITGTNGATVYLLGSVHLLTPQSGVLPSEVEVAFARSPTVALETSLDSVMLNAQALLDRARYADGGTLRASVPPAAIARLEAVLPAYGLSVEQLKGFKPWFVSVMAGQIAVQRVGFKAEYDVDVQINERARAAGKRVVGLEPVGYQFAMFDNMPVADQAEMLSEIPPLDSAVKELMRIKAAWVAGDTAALGALVAPRTPAAIHLDSAVVLQRNLNWLPKIESFLGGPHDVLVVVGAAHLFGTQGLLALLRERGYRIEQL